MIALAEQKGFTWAAPPTIEQPKRQSSAKRTKLPWRKQWTLFNKPDPNDLRSFVARPLSQFNGRELTGQEIAFKPISDATHEDFAHLRPRVVGDCQPGGVNEQRPCPWVSCQFNLYLDINEDGALKLNFPGMALDDPRVIYTCALDAASDQAAKGPKAPPRDFVAIGKLLNTTGNGARKLIARAEERMREEAEEEEIEPSWDDGPIDVDLYVDPIGEVRGVSDAVSAAPEADKWMGQRKSRKR